MKTKVSAKNITINKIKTHRSNQINTLKI